jgi:hypothetical protein
MSVESTTPAASSKSSGKGKGMQPKMVAYHPEGLFKLTLF